MHLFYYDEVKHQPPEQTAFWLGGICCHSEELSAIEEMVNDISLGAFGSRLLQKSTEFHGIEICGGKGNFKKVELERRIDYLAELLAVIAKPEIKRLYVQIIPANITHATTPPEEIAFMYLVEQVDGLFQELKTVGMMFGDYDEPQIGPSVASLSQFREGGTSWSRKRKINNIIDTVHFAQSHHSRLIQLADIYLYCLQFSKKPNTSFARSKIAKVIQESGILEGATSRVWPQEAMWYRR